MAQRVQEGVWCAYPPVSSHWWHQKRATNVPRHYNYGHQPQHRRATPLQQPTTNVYCRCATSPNIAASIHYQATQMAPQRRHQLRRPLPNVVWFHAHCLGSGIPPCPHRYPTHCIGVPTGGHCSRLRLYNRRPGINLRNLFIKPTGTEISIRWGQVVANASANRATEFSRPPAILKELVDKLVALESIAEDMQVRLGKMEQKAEVVRRLQRVNKELAHEVDQLSTNVEILETSVQNQRVSESDATPVLDPKYSR